MAVVLITGTSGGIGLVTALHFARQGHEVHASMRNLERAGALREAAEQERLPVQVVQLDVNDPASVERGVGEVLQRAGRIDVLVNNAGISAGRTIEETPDEALKSVYETNVFGAFRTMRAVAPGMRERRSGSVVNVSSGAGRVFGGGNGVYGSSKAALEALSEAFGQEMRPFDVRVTIVEPGVVVTPLGARPRQLDTASPWVDVYRRNVILFRKRVEEGVQPQEVAEMIGRAALSGERRFRYVIGRDSEQRIAGRKQISDEDWIDFARPMSDEDYYKLYRDYFGMDVLSDMPASS